MDAPLLRTPRSRSLIFRAPLVIVTAFLLLWLVPSNSPAQKRGAIPGDVRQLIVATADGWDSHRGAMFVFQRKSARAAWQRVLFKRPVPVLFGKNGMAWGRGTLAIPTGATREVFKREGDGRTPAGCFQLGRVYGYAAALPRGSRYPYKQVTKWDAWIDDVKHPLYNRHYLANPDQDIPPWFEKNRMRLGDFAYAWKLEIRHNSDPPAAGAGSAIFFHIRRGENRPTSGCTTMTKGNLLTVLGWLKTDANAHYAVLPDVEYARLQKPWQLPELR
jgi:L,D-peptidoglycan transpeptidase YkuD (ErfK/YbiS/YcfS/YnhG family)